MQRIALGITMALFAAGAAPGQNADTTTAFDVASIRVSQSGKDGSRHESIQSAPDSVTMRNVSLRSSIRWAYHVMDYQITGPDWISVERYDITAKAAAAVPEEGLRRMLQTLLAERFKLVLHHQTKELPAYLLQVGKNGPKFQESKTEGETSVVPDRARLSVTVKRAPVSQLVEMLSQTLRAPVVDMTGLKGKYDLTLDASKYIADLQPGAGPADIVSLIIVGVQEEFGLKLEYKKAQLDLLIFDSAERAPIEN